MRNPDFKPEPFNDVEPLAPGVTLWRYMDFVKYVSLLSSSALYCSSAASFSDPFEGAVGLVENRPDYEAEIAAQLKRLKEETLGGHTPKEAVVQLERESFLRRKTTFVNCWYESDYESMAMWRLYSTDNSNAVAIRTTYGRMRDALKVKTGVGIGRVNYIDFSNPPDYFMNGISRFWYKSNHFAHENEVRIMPYHIYEGSRTNAEEIPPGVLLPMDLNVLIDKVYVAPWAQPWLLFLVKEVSEKYSLDVEVVTSTQLLLTAQSAYILVVIRWVVTCWFLRSDTNTHPSVRPSNKRNMSVALYWLRSTVRWSSETGECLVRLQLYIIHLDV